MRSLFCLISAILLVLGLAIPAVVSAEEAARPEAEIFDIFDSDSADGEEGTEVEGQAGEEAQDFPAVALPDPEPGLAKARATLAEDFGHFLERRDLGFDLDLAELIYADVEYLVSQTSDRLMAPSTIDPWAVLQWVIALLILALFSVTFLLIERQTTRWANRWQARLHFDSSPGLTSAIRKILLLLGRSIAVPLLILFSYFPVRAILSSQSWPLLLTDGLVLFLLYRLGKTGLAAVLRLNPRDEEGRKQALQLELFGVTALRVALVFLFALAAIERFEYHEELAALVSFAFRLSIALLPLYLFFIRDAVLGLIPSKSSSRLFKGLRRALAANYYAILALSIVLLLFNAAGYVDAATYLLTRGYALIVVAGLWLFAMERLQYLVENRAEEADEAGEVASPLPRAIRQWVLCLGSLMVVVTVLKIMKLYDPLLVVLKIPFLIIGHLQISIFNLLNVALIIVATVLSIRLVKAVLNAKVYPTLKVEVGAAYAMNTLLNYALVVAAFILCLVALGVHLSAVMVVMASLGVGIGFGLQNIAENLLSGFILLFGRAVQKGDFITVNDLYGRVEAVGARSVVVRTPDNFSMLVPSKEIVSGRIVNWTFQDSIVRIHIPVGVSYSSDPNHVREVLLEAATRHPDILTEPAPDIWITDFGDNAIKFELLVYFDCRTTNERSLKGQFNFILWEALQKAGVGIPFPQRDLHLRSVDKTIGFPDSWARPTPESSRPENDRSEVAKSKSKPESDKAASESQ